MNQRQRMRRVATISQWEAEDTSKQTLHTVLKEILPVVKRKVNDVNTVKKKFNDVEVETIFYDSRKRVLVFNLDNENKLRLSRRFKKVNPFHAVVLMALKDSQRVFYKPMTSVEQVINAGHLESWDRLFLVDTLKVLERKRLIKQKLLKLTDFYLLLYGLR